MFNSSVIGSIMNMTAQIYIQQNTQDSNTGAISRAWVYDKTIPCKVEPIKTRGTSSRGDNKSFNPANNAQGSYDERLQLKIKTLQLLSKRWRVDFIRSSDGQQVFFEVDRYGKPDSIFEVTSSHAVLDPFGKISYFESSLVRVSVQDNDPTIN
jgi:hypothetical protein